MFGARKIFLGITGIILRLQNIKKILYSISLC